VNVFLWAGVILIGGAGSVARFVADGLVFPDRTPSPGLLDFAAVIAPARQARVEQRVGDLDRIGDAGI